MAAAEKALARQKFVTPIDVCLGIGCAIALAVVASIRHEDTDYDDLLMSGTARADARTQIKPAIDRVLAVWSAG